MPFDESMLSPDQKLIADHDTNKHGRVQAGPGTGKSLTAIALLGKLQEWSVRARMLTYFTNVSNCHPCNRVCHQ
jgi:hypothetical protein